MSKQSAWTPGPWHATNHFANPDTPCNCAYVLSEGYAGGICEIAVDNGRNIADGGNDAPPAEEAAANARLIAAAPCLFEALHNMVALAERHFTDAPETLALNAAVNALAKAKGA